MAIKAFSGGISQQPLPDFNLTDVEDGDFLQFDGDVKAFVNIRNLVIPTTLGDLTNDLNYITRQELESAITGAQISDSNGGTVDLSDYATVATLNGHVLTINARIDALDLEKADQTYVDAMIANLDIPDTDDFVTHTHLNTVITALGTNTPDLSGYVTDSELATAINGIQLPDTSSFLTEAQIDAKIAAIDVSDQIATNISDLNDDIGIATQAWVAQELANVGNGANIDLSGYVTEAELSTAIANIVIPTPFSGDYNDLTNTPSIPTVPTNVSAFTNDAGYLTQHQDLSAYATTADLSSAISNIAMPTPFSGDYNDLANKPTIPTLTGYATEAWVTQQLANIDDGAEVDLSGYATTADLATAINNIDLTPYALKTDLPTVFTGDYNDLTNKPVIPSAPDLTPYALTTDLPDTSDFVTLADINARNFITISDVTALDYITISDVTALDYITISDVTALDYITISDVTALDYITISDVTALNYVTISDVTAAIAANAVDTSNFITTSQLALELQNYVRDGDLTDQTTLVTDTELATYNYASRDYVDAQIASITDSDNQTLTLTGNVLSISGGNLVDLSELQQDLSPYATNASVAQQIASINTFSGDYNDLVNKPTIFSGSYIDLADKPTIPVLPTNVAAFVNDANYQTQQEVQTAITNAIPDLTPYALSADIPQPTDLSNYALRSEIPSLVGLATVGYVDSRISSTHQDLVLNGNLLSLTDGNTVDLSSLATGTGSVDLTGYATENWVTTQLNSYQPTVDLTNYVTESELATELANYQPTVDLTGYVTDSELQTAIDNISLTPGPKGDTGDTGPQGPAGSDGVDGQNGTDGADGASAYEVAVSNGFVGTETEWLDSLVGADGQGADLTGYATEAYVQQEIANVNSGGSVDLSNYYTKTETDALIPTVPTDVNQLADADGLLVHSTPFSGDYNDLINTPALFDGDYNSLTNRPDLSLYALSANIPDVTGLATESYVDQQIAAVQSGGQIDLSGYVTETELNTALSNVNVSGASALDDLTDVAVGSLPQVANADEHYLLEYNPVNELWESRDFGEIFATQAYVSATIATQVSEGTINLDGYATEQFVEQKLVERGHHFSGDYYDLANTPILFSGDYNDLLNKPADNSDLRLDLQGSELRLMNVEPDPDTIVSTVDLVDLGAAIAGNINYDDIANLPNLFSGNYADLVNRPNLFSGNYNDLNNKPYIPSIAGLATEQYVDNRWAEPEITGDRIFTHDVEIQGQTSLVVKESTQACARHDNYVMCVETTDSVTTEALLVGGGRIAIEDNSTVMYEAHIIGSTGTHKYGIRLKGIADHTNGTLSLIGSPSRETLTENEYAWTADVAVDSVNNSLKLTVVGSENIDVHWTIFVECNVVKR